MKALTTRGTYSCSFIL